MSIVKKKISYDDAISLIEKDSVEFNNSIAHIKILFMLVFRQKN